MGRVLGPEQTPGWLFPPPPPARPSPVCLPLNTLRPTPHVTRAPGAKRQTAAIIHCQRQPQTQVKYTYVFTSSCQVANEERKASFSKNKSKLLLLFLPPSNSCYVLISGPLQDAGTKGTIYKHYYETQRGSEHNKILSSQENWRDLLPNIVTAWKMHFPFFNTSSPSPPPALTKLIAYQAIEKYF